MATLDFVDEFDFAYPYASVETTPSPPMPSLDFSFDPSFLGLDMDFYQPYTTPRQSQPMHHSSHTRSSSRASVYSAVSTVESTPDSVCTRATTPPRASTPIRHHGPILLPKIRSQDQELGIDVHQKQQQQQQQPIVTFTPPAPSRPTHARSSRVVSHSRSQTNPETLSNMALAHMSFSSQPPEDMSSSLLCSPPSFVNSSSRTSPPQQQQQQQASHIRRSSSVDAATIEKYGYPTYRQMPASIVHQQRQLPEFSFPSSFAPRAPSPLGFAAAAGNVTPEPAPSTTLLSFLTAPNPAASLVRTVNYPYRDPHIRHFWWDVRSVRAWTGFTASSILALPGASALLTTPVPAPVLPQPAMASRHPETEAALHAIYASYYLPKLNAALALSSSGRRPLQLSVPSTATRTAAASSSSSSASASSSNELLFTANVAGEAATAAAMFGGKPSARVVGIVRTFDRFNTGMRAEGNIKRVEYLRTLAAVHHAMREHGCRYGFILTEIELVLVRNGTEATPHFGDLEITSVQLAATAGGDSPNETQMTACLALWGLCQLAGDNPQPAQAPWRAEIGAPAEGTRRKAQPRDKWMPAPQLAEKREAKRSRGWVWPEDPVGRKELGKRGVRYGGI